MEEINRSNRVGYIIEYESGELSDSGTLALFAHLIKTGDAYRLQGSYGRMAERLIKAGLIDRQGNVLDTLLAPPTLRTL